MLTRREIALWGLAFLLSLPAVTTRLYASDEIEHFAWLRSVTFDRDVDFDNEYRHFFDAGIARGPGFHETFLERVNETGRRINYAPVGAAVFWAPFYAVGHGVAAMTGAPTDGLSQPYVAAVAYASACYAFAAMLLSAAIARKLLGRGLAAAAVIAAGTPLIFYAYVAPGFVHAASAFAVALFVWTWLRVRRQWSVRGALALGITGGLMALVREQDVLLVVGPGVDFLLQASRTARPARSHGGRGVIVAAVAGAVAFVAAISPQLLAYQALNGHIGQTETAARKMTWTSPHAFGVLFSPEHGLLAWTPLTLVAFAGLIWLAVRKSAIAGSRATDLHPDTARIARLMLLMIGAQIYTSGVVESWTVAGSFGQRRFIALTPILTVGVAAAFTATARSPLARRALVGATALAIWWNIGLMAQFGLHRMDRQRLTLLDNARLTYLELPLEAPGIAWRYLTDRSSFYKRPRE